MDPIVSVVWAAGGTRRQAALEQVADAAYVTWALQHQLEVAARFFKRGVQHLFLPVLGPPQVREIGPYRERLFNALQAIGSPFARAAYAQMDVRVRAYGQQHIPQLPPLLDDLAAVTADARQGTLWYTMVVNHEQEALEAAVRAAGVAGATTHAAMVKAFYGEAVPSVDVFVGFGKPMVGYLMPPLLGERAHCYWTTHPSYQLSDDDIDRIFSDAMITRTTWRADKQNRYRALNPETLRAYYAHRYTLGVGEQHQGFWYPCLTPPPPSDE